MTAAWPSVQISEVCELIVDCVNKTAPVVEGPTPYKMIRTTNVRDGWVDTASVRYVEENVYNQWIRRGAPKRGDVILTREAPLGEVGLLRDDKGIFLGQRLVMYRANPEKLDNCFLLYSFLHHDLQGQIRAFGSGSTVEHMRVPDCEKLTLKVPPLETQRKIATILSAYDDLIENNTRRIKILEEMAQAIYREWFVNFRFPGYEKVKMVDSPLGRVPEGWGVKTVSDVAIIHRGRSYKSQDLVGDGGLPFLNLKCIERDGGFRYDGVKRYQGQFKDSQAATVGEIIMAVTDMTQERRLVARAARVPDIGEEKAIISMDLVKISPKVNTVSEWLYGMFRFSGFPDGIKQYANGANVLHLKPDHIGGFAFPLPTKELQDRYGEIAEGIYRQCDNLNRKNQNLCKTGDLLLPKLISGEVDVSELEIEVKGAAA